MSARKRTPAKLRWHSVRFLISTPVYNPAGAAAGVMVLRAPDGRYTAAAAAFPAKTVDAAKSGPVPMATFLDDHAHAVIAEKVTLGEAVRRGEAWARSFRAGHVLPPACACEDMAAPRATRRRTGPARKTA